MSTSQIPKSFLRSNIRSVNPTRGEIANKSFDKPIDIPFPISSYDPNIEIDSTTSKIPVSGGVIGKDEINCNKKPTRKSPRLYNKQSD